VKVDSAARGYLGNLCDKCFAVLKPASTYCEDCGAPQGGSPGSDSIVYPEIARANLLRLKGDIDEAEKVCLSILRRFPNNPAAHGMMGDLCFEAGKLENAKQWYEMTLDLTPNDEGLRRKLKAVDESATEQMSDAGLAGLEVRPRSGGTIAAMVGVVVLVVALAGLMFWLGYANKKTRADVIDPISVNGEAPPRTTPVEPEATQPEAPAPAPNIAMTAEEASTKAALEAELGALGSRVGGLVMDSSGAVATVTGAASDQMDAAHVGAWLVKRGSAQAYVRIIDPNTRGVRFSGTVTKAALDATTEDPGTPGWATAVLSTG
jgi:hypothetical protein